MQGKYLVIGSAHLDILATVTGDDLTTDKIGTVSIEIGGTAANLAMNLAKLGAKVSMLTAMDDSPYSRIITDYVQDAGVDLLVEQSPVRHTAAFSAHIDEAGELMSAISSMPVEGFGFDFQKIGDLMDGIDALLVECNLSVATLDTLVCLANDRMIPVFVAGVSEEKCLRIKGITGKVDAVFLNRREFGYLRRRHYMDLTSYSEVAAALNTTLVVTADADGVFIARASRLQSLPPPVDRDKVGNRLGAGDAFMAATVFKHILDLVPIETAAKEATGLVCEVMRRTNCHTGAPDSVQSKLEEIEMHATKDAVTGLANRSYTQHHIHKMVERTTFEGGQLAMLVLDIDHFKRINDTYGHDEGDRILRRVGDVIKANLRATDWAGRWGGEEFLAVLHGATRETAAAVAERIRVAVQDSISDFNVTISCGVSFHGDDGYSMHEIVKAADTRLYAAKEGGRNRVVLGCMNMAQSQ